MSIIKAGVGGGGPEGLEIAEMTPRTGTGVMFAELSPMTARLGHAHIRTSQEMQRAKVHGVVARQGRGTA